MGLFYLNPKFDNCNFWLNKLKTKIRFTSTIDLHNKFSLFSKVLISAFSFVSKSIMILANEKVCQYLKTPPLLCKEGWSFCFTFRHLVRVRINFLGGWNFNLVSYYFSPIHQFLNMRTTYKCRAICINVKMLQHNLLIL